MLEKQVIEGNVVSQSRGQRYAFLLSLFLLFGGILLTAIGKPTAGLSILAGDVVAIIGVFVYGRIAQKKERVEKAREIELPAATSAPELPGLK